MDISTAHTDARWAVSRLPSINASLALLVAAMGGPYSTIEIYGTVKPTPGADPGGLPVVTLTMTESAGTVLGDPDYQIVITTPLEAQITGADPANGTLPIWARVKDPAGVWWADVTVTVAGAGGEIQIIATGTEGDPAAPVARLYNGAYCRLTSIIFQG